MLKKLQVFAAVTLGVGIVANSASADVIVESGDSWVRAISPDTAFSGDLLAVWSPSVSGDERASVIEFDLSGHTGPITAASLALWSDAFGFSEDNVPLVQLASAVDPADITDSEATNWNEVAAATVMYTFESFGTYNIPAVVSDPALDGTYLHSVATANDVAFLENVRTGSGTLMLILRAVENGTDYRGAWGDGEFAGNQPLLNTNIDAVPEPASLTLLGLGMLMITKRLRR